jgi:hypothetical protein
MRRPASFPSLLLAAALLLAGGPPARPAEAGIRVDAAFLLHTDGDGEALAAGLQVPGCGEDRREAGRWCAAALAAARDFLAGEDIVLRQVGVDRWRRPLVVPERPGGEDLQTRLLRAGLAFVDPAAGPAADVRRWFAAEREARAGRTGIWGEDGLAPLAAGRVRSGPVRFRPVCGEVRRAASTRFRVYLEFGADPRRDFTVRMAPATARAAALRDPRRLAGREICVRGWIFESRGPMIEVVDPSQLEPAP